MWPDRVIKTHLCRVDFNQGNVYAFPNTYTKHSSSLIGGRSSNKTQCKQRQTVKSAKCLLSHDINKERCRGNKLTAVSTHYYR